MCLFFQEDSRGNTRISVGWDGPFLPRCCGGLSLPNLQQLQEGKLWGVRPTRAVYQSFRVLVVANRRFNGRAPCSSAVPNPGSYLSDRDNGPVYFLLAPRKKDETSYSRDYNRN